MTSLSSLGVDALLRAARFLEKFQDSDQLNDVLQENIPATITKEENHLSKDESSSNFMHFVNTSELSATTELSRSAIPIPNVEKTLTIYSLNENLNLSTDSSGYVTCNNVSSSGSNSSFNQTTANPEDLEINKGSADQNVLDQPQSLCMLTNVTSSTHVRRRTISSNSNSNRSPSTVRAGTREVHNKLEKNRRAHLKECFETLKKQIPMTPDEKKTSNLSILGAAIRHIQTLKRKEREYEHEMERLAKEKISAQNRILCLKRELQQWDIDYSKFLPENVVEINGGDKPNNINIVNAEDMKKTNRLYSPTLSFGNELSIISPADSNFKPNTIPIVAPLIEPMQTSKRVIEINPIHTIPIGAKKSLVDELVSTNNSSSVPTITAGNTLNQNNFMQSHLIYTKPSDNLMQNLPLNLHTSKNNALPEMSHSIKNGSKIVNGDSKMITSSLFNSIATTMPTNNQQTSITSSSLIKSDSSEPPTKLIKLIGNNAILAPIDKDNKVVHSGHITLQQVVGGGGLVVSPIQLVTSPQNLKFIGQPNGLTTIELNAPSLRGQVKNNMRSQFAPAPSQHNNIQKILMNNSGYGTTSAASISSLNIPALSHSHMNGHLSQITPGGAELNILSSCTPSNNGNIYQSQGGKLAIVKEINNGNKIHLMHSTPTIMVSQSQNVNIISSSSQISAKLLQSSNTKPTKSMILLNHSEKKCVVSTSESVKSCL